VPKIEMPKPDHSARRAIATPVKAGWVLAAAGAALIAAAPAMAAAGQRPAVQPEVTITASPGKTWTLAYRLPRPAKTLLFARSPDASRLADWTAPADFEIVQTPAGEAVKRRDGAAFRAVTVTTPAAYRVLPNDYAPFSPFGDGGMLFHTGRFFACADACPEKAAWPMRLAAPGGQGILLDGKRLTGRAAWTDTGEGRSVYVGEAKPISSPQLLAVIDTALPPEIREPLVARLPRFMGFYAQRLGALATPPMLFASYDVAHPKGSGSQGGALPGEVAVHFYGATWPDQMKKPDFLPDLDWFFAHEAGHIFQRQLFISDREGWVHEGGAEAFAAMALREIEPATAGYVDRRIAKARTDCAKQLGGRSVQQAIDAKQFKAAYSCGLILNLAIDRAVRAASPGAEGLFAVWRDFIATAGGKPALSEDDYLASLGRVGGPKLAEAVKVAVRSPAPDFDLGAQP
jgi:hypothetical protein